MARKGIVLCRFAPSSPPSIGRAYTHRCRQRPCRTRLLPLPHPCGGGEEGASSARLPPFHGSLLQPGKRLIELGVGLLATVGDRHLARHHCRVIADEDL